ncbi:MAG: dTMP kinase [Pirellulales bacterium]|nr:dTMP kinase [Pirellulales bacterium]
MSSLSATPDSPFFSFDGIDGVGKSTQIERFVAWLRASGCDVVPCRDPGSTPLGEAIRDILLHREEIPLAARAEMLLYMAARAQLVEEVVRPALALGKIVVSDRFLLANVVYQGYAGGLDIQSLWEVGQTAVGGLLPDLTIVLDMPAEAAAGRLHRPLDRMERQGAEFHARVREGFLAEAARRPERIRVVDAARTVEAVQADLRAAVEAFLSKTSTHAASP